ncbi:hypothetical protein HMPREF1529_03054 [Microbacterium sp. oral taxon 186 str. F0373]|nr:hypothetical protein OR221_3198 [Microbacterium laevaniformans OR221]EPD83016.1 hypothetical protein HMPREF1529_03054 [Microbacterium sp. oral taxon 186 str. F0373]
MVGRQGRDPRFSENRLGIKASTIVWVVDECCVDLASTNEVRMLSPRAQLDGDRFGAGLGRSRSQNVVEQAAVSIRLHRKENTPRRSRSAASTASRSVQILQSRLDVRQKSGPRIGQGDRSGCSAKQHDAEFGLKGANGAGQRWRSDPQFLCCASEAALLGDGSEVAQRPRLDRHSKQSMTRTFTPFVPGVNE